jgi:hypothetical protein
MEKVHTNYHPRLEQDQVDFTRAVISMLNARRYLGSQGYSEIIKSGYSDENTNGIAGGYGAIRFPDGSEVDNDDFKGTTDRDSVLERVIEKNSIFQKRGQYDKHEMPRVVRCTYSRDGYGVRLSVADTTKSKKGFFGGMFRDSELFAFAYTLSLNKDVITDDDLKQFEVYVQGLDQAAQEDKPLIYTPQHTPSKRSEAQPRVQPVQTDFINPWEIEIPKLGDKK